MSSLTSARATGTDAGCSPRSRSRWRSPWAAAPPGQPTSPGATTSAADTASTQFSLNVSNQTVTVAGSAPTRRRRRPSCRRSSRAWALDDRHRQAQRRPRLDAAERPGAHDAGLGAGARRGAEPQRQRHEGADRGQRLHRGREERGRGRREGGLHGRRGREQHLGRAGVLGEGREGARVVETPGHRLRQRLGPVERPGERGDPADRGRRQAVRGHR